MIEFLYRFLMMIAGNSFREESICCQILGPLNLTAELTWQNELPD